MTVAEQISLANSGFFRPVMVKALNQACEQLLTSFQVAAPKKIDVKLYDYALAFSKQCFINDYVFNSCISNLLDDAQYIDPQADPDAAMTALFDTILADYQASFIRGGSSVYPSWIERIAGYVKGDEELMTP